MTTTYQRLAFVRKPDLLDDTLSQAAIAAVESTAVHMDDFLNGVLSQLRRVTGLTNWYDAIESVSADPRDLKSLTDDVYYKTLLRRRQNLADITVPATQNYVVLNVAGSAGPAETAAAGAGSASGAVVAILAGDVGANALTEVAGLNAILPKNLLVIRDAATLDPLYSDELGVQREIFGLLQAESGVDDGDTFNDTTKQVQISFVRQTTGGDDLEAVPFADIQNKGINYSYVSRTQFHLMHEQDFLAGSFADAQAFTVTTLQQAYLAANTIDVLTSEGDLIVNLSQDLTEFEIRRGGVNFTKFTRNDSTGDVIQVDADTLDINLTNDVDFSQGSKFDTAGTTINVGVTAGQVDATILGIRATTGDLTLRGADDVQFITVRETVALPLDDGTTGAISALPGGPYTSIAGAIRAALLSSDLDIFTQVIQSVYARDVNVPGAGNGNAQDWSPALSFTTRSIDMNTPSTVDTILFYNGSLVFGGNSSTNNDAYVGTTPANGDLKYDFLLGVRSGDVVIAISWKPS